MNRQLLTIATVPLGQYANTRTGTNGVTVNEQTSTDIYITEQSISIGNRSDFNEVTIAVVVVIVLIIIVIVSAVVLIVVIVLLKRRQRQKSHLVAINTLGEV